MAPSVEPSSTQPIVHPFFAGESLRTGAYNVQVCETVSSVEFNDASGCDAIPFQIQSINKNPKFPAVEIQLTSGKDTPNVEIGKQYIMNSGVYSIFIKDSLGCSSMLNSYLTLSKSNCTDIFSPNNDGIADEIFLDGTGKAIVRNKGGVILCELNLPGSWSGNDSNGKPVSIGLYVVEFSNGSQKKVTLVR